jgi:hypothetical protein
MIDPRPSCRFCGRRWVPREGVDATVAFCGRCRAARQASANRSFEAQNKQAVMVGGYVVRVAKNA